MSFRRPRAILEGKSLPVRRGPAMQSVAVAAPPVSIPKPAVAPASEPLRKTVAPASLKASQPLVRIGSVLMSLFLFIYFSRLLDVTSSVTMPLHIPMFLMIGLLVLAISAGGIGRVSASKIGIFEVLFMVWAGVAAAFSTWRTGSLLVYRDCMYSALVFFAILALVRNMTQLARVARAMAFAGLAAALFSFTFTQSMRGGRIAVDIGSLADPNEYALVLLMTLPYWWLVARISKAQKIMTAVSIVAAIPILVAFFRTGSRAGLLTLLGLVGAVFLRSRPTQRMALVVTVILVLLVAVFTLPPTLRDRYVTWFSTSAQDQQEYSADIDSSTARRYFLMQSLALTLQHPLLGLGPGQFAGINWEVSKAAGKQIAAQPTHNTYTEVSSETGIPGLILFAGTLILCLRSALRIAKLTENKPGLQAISCAATCTFVSISAFMVGAFFLSLAYSPLVTAAMGLTAALRNVAADEFGIVLDRRI